jgi:ADP-dependent NAD(P)H-hydrate dehydratase / NAD(P)H-hydrate epimerase
LQMIPAGSILTPHPKEFERLFGKTANEFDRIALAMEKAKVLNCTIILKGHNTFIATPDGKGFFNNTGNPGMATAGSGDVLTGILTGLLAQGYGAVESALCTCMEWLVILPQKNFQWKVCWQVILYNRWERYFRLL